MKNNLLLFLAGLFSLALPFSAYAADFEEIHHVVIAPESGGMTQLVFEVPVRVTNAPADVGSVVASCNVEFGTGSDAMGMPSSVILDTGGNLNRIFRVTVAFESSRMNDANGYRCSLVLYTSATGGLLAGGSMIETQSGIALDPAATQVFVVSGSL